MGIGMPAPYSDPDLTVPDLNFKLDRHLLSPSLPAFIS
jgi:hypothetical protein